MNGGLYPLATDKGRIVGVFHDKTRTLSLKLDERKPYGVVERTIAWARNIILNTVRKARVLYSEDAYVRGVIVRALRGRQAD